MATILIERQLRDNNYLEPHKDFVAESKTYEPRDHVTSHLSSQPQRRRPVTDNHDNNNNNNIASKHTKNKQCSNEQQPNSVKLPAIGKESREQCQRSLATGASADVSRVTEPTTNRSTLRQSVERQRHERQFEPYRTMSTTISSRVENTEPTTNRKSIRLRGGGGRGVQGVPENGAVSDRNGGRQTQRKQGHDVTTSSNGLVAAPSNSRQIKRQETKVHKSSPLSAAAAAALSAAKDVSAFDSCPTSSTTRQQGHTVPGNGNGLSPKTNPGNNPQLTATSSTQRHQLPLRKSKDVTRASAVPKTSSRRRVTAATVNASLKQHSKRPENGDAIGNSDIKVNPKQKVVTEDDSELEDDVFVQ